ncbi:MAG: glutamate-cysteine ligase family protein, partial [Pseudomonadota bacterium]
LSTIFPEVRLKRFLEMRGSDSGPWDSLCAMPAFWVGLLYDDQALDEAWELVKDWTAAEREAMRRSAPALGLKAAAPCGRLLQDFAKHVIDIAHGGLKRRAKLGQAGDDETGFLHDLREIAETGKTPADRLLDLYYGPWGRNLKKVFEERAY